MHRFACSTVAALAVTCASMSAQANASAVITIRGIQVMSLDATGANEYAGGLTGGVLQPRESRTFSFDYSLAVQVDGLASNRQNALCAQWSPLGGRPGFTCIRPTGFEVAAAELTLGTILYPDPRNPPPWFVVTGGVVVGIRVDGPGPTFESLSGTADITLTNLDSSPHDVLIGQSRYVIVDSVPEPESYALLIAGLGLLSWRGRRVNAECRASQVFRAVDVHHAQGHDLAIARNTLQRTQLAIDL